MTLTQFHSDAPGGLDETTESIWRGSGVMILGAQDAIDCEPFEQLLMTAERRSPKLAMSSTKRSIVGFTLEPLVREVEQGMQAKCLGHFEFCPDALFEARPFYLEVLRAQVELVERIIVLRATPQIRGACLKNCVVLVIERDTQACGHERARISTTRLTGLHQREPGYPLFTHDPVCQKIQGDTTPEFGTRQTPTIERPLVGVASMIDLRILRVE